jgi:hypothetical protein
VTPGGSALLDHQLFLPESWCAETPESWLAEAERLIDRAKSRRFPLERKTKPPFEA